MNRGARIAGSLTLVFLLGGSAIAYTPPRWQFGPEILASQWPDTSAIPISVNTDAPNTIVSGSRPFLAVKNMFERRSAYTPLLFDISPTSAVTDLGQDGVNLVTFVDTPQNQSASFGFAAVTWFWWNVIDDEPVMTESDILFTNNFPHTTTGSGGIDIEGLGGHELIHFMSFDHSAVIASTAFPSYFSPVPNERNFAQDDLSAMGYLHPFSETPLITGSISGTVQKPGAIPVFGAHVVAQRVSDGTPVSDISVTGGEWRIDALPAGEYQVYVEPLDGPSFPNNTLFSGVYVSEPVDTAIQTTFAGGNQTPTTFQVAAGADTFIGAIEVPSVGTDLNPQNLGLNPTPTAWIAATAVNVDQGWFAYLTVHGPGIASVPDDGVTVSGPDVIVFSSPVIRGSFQGAPYMVVPISIGANAEPGVRSIWATNGARIASLTGGLEIHPSNPRPDLLRSDAAGSATPAAVAAQLPLDPVGPDHFRGTGEGSWRPIPGSQDDDDFYVPAIPSGFLDPDVSVLTDPLRPLVLYRLDDPGRTIFLGKTGFGRLEVTYTDSP